MASRSLTKHAGMTRCSNWSIEPDPDQGKAMKPLLIILLLLNTAWGQVQFLTLKKGSDVIIVKPNDRIKIVTNKNNVFSKKLYSFRISEYGIKENNEWEIIQSIQISQKNNYGKKYAKWGLLALSFLAISEVASTEGGELEIMYILFAGGNGYIFGYIIGYIMGPYGEPMIIGEGKWEIVTH